MGNERSILNNEKSNKSANNGQHAFDDIILVIFDESNENKLSKCDLRSFVHTIEKFSQLNQCEEYLQNEINDQQKIFLVLFNPVHEKFVSRINQLTSIQSIYLFCENQTYHQYWTNISFQSPKNLFFKPSELYNQLEEDVKLCQNDLIRFDVINHELNKLPAHFMYSKLLKEILIHIPYDQNSKKEFLNYCLQQPHHSYNLQILQEFENDYEKHSSIWWYTRECFLYQMLNKALRTENIDVLILMGFFIRDLHRQIESFHQMQSHCCSMVVYRGQGMTNQQFDKLIRSGNGLISFETFLSTSLDKNVSLQFARRAIEKPGIRGIIFRMEINRKLTNLSSLYASIEKLSYYQNNEKEVLFSTHTVFRIESIRQMKDENIWQIDLRLTTNEEDIQLEQLTKHLRQDLQSIINPRESLAKLLFIMGLNKKSEEIYQNLLENTSEYDFEQLAYLHHQLGCISHENKEFSRALQHFEKSLEIKINSSPDQSNTHPQLAQTYLNIGSIYHKQRNLEKAFYYFNLTLQTQTTNQRILASVYNNIGMLYKSQNQYSNALEYFQKSLQIDSNTLPSTHPDLARTNLNIGRVYLAMNDLTNARTYFQRTLQICRLSLPDRHPLLSLAMENYRKTLILQPQNSFQDHLFTPGYSTNHQMKHCRGFCKFLSHHLRINRR